MEQGRKWRRVGGAFAAVAAGLYLPFGWLLAALGSGRPDATQWIWLWPILPGFVPGALLAYPGGVFGRAVMGATTLGLLAILTSLGASTPRRLRIAVGVALLVAIPSSIVAYRYSSP